MTIRLDPLQVRASTHDGRRFTVVFAHKGREFAIQIEQDGDEPPKLARNHFTPYGGGRSRFLDRSDFNRNLAAAVLQLVTDSPGYFGHARRLLAVRQAQDAARSRAENLAETRAALIGVASDIAADQPELAERLREIEATASEDALLAIHAALAKHFR